MLPLTIDTGSKPQCGRCAKAVSEIECIYDLEKDEHSRDDHTVKRFKSSDHGTPRASDSTLLSPPTIRRDHGHGHGESQRVMSLGKQVKELQEALAARQSQDAQQKDISSESRTVSNVLGLCFP